MQGQKNENQAIVTVKNALPFRTEVNRPNIGGDTVAVAAVIPEEPASYSSSDLQFRILRYLCPLNFIQV